MTGAQEDAWQKARLTMAIGVTGSGAVRYAAAMYFYNRLQLSDDLLEIYRRCCKFDAENPCDLAVFEGLTLPKLLQGYGEA